MRLDPPGEFLWLGGQGPRRSGYPVWASVLAMADPEMRRALLEFEIALDAAAADEVRVEGWGRAFLSPSLPLVWDASYLVLERSGMAMAEVEALAEEVLGKAGFAHRTVVVVDEAEGERLAGEAEAVAGWSAERNRYMVWRGEPGEGASAGATSPGAVRSKASYPGKSANGPAGVRQVSAGAVEPLRRQLNAELTPDGEDDPAATVEQLLEYGRRQGEAGAVRWFVAPAEGSDAATAGPAAACCLFNDGEGIGQVEDVATLEAARGRGLATAVAGAARAASQAAGDTTTFITADAADWPQFFYEKLGFVPIGDLHILRRRPGV
jgi:GNAT superfamily N-acetyltransferase